MFVLCWTWFCRVGLWEEFGSLEVEQQQQRRWDVAFKSILFPSFFLCGRFFLPRLHSFLTFEFSASFAE